LSLSPSSFPEHFEFIQESLHFLAHLKLFNCLRVIDLGVVLIY